MDHILSLIIFIPLLAMVALLAVPKVYAHLYKSITVGITGIQMILAIVAFCQFDGDGAQYQMVEKYDWIDLSLGSLGALSVDYFVAVDGINVSMILLGGIVMFIGAIASWKITNNTKGYFALYLLLSSVVLGCFVAMDFFLFFLFFEFMLLPMYFLIGMWGGPRREYASIKFFIYTLFGSIFILIVMIGLYISVIDDSLISQDVVHTFSFIKIANPDNYIAGAILAPDTTATMFGLPMREVAFLALFLGFAIKLPMVPFHTWLPDAHVEAPTPISVVLAGILLKIGGYGLIRTAYTFFPDAAIQYATWVAFFGMISILYGAYNAFAQKDLKKLIAYSSVSHMGFVLLGLASFTVEGVTGAMYQMFSHGFISALLFLVVGVVYDRTHDRQIESYKGLALKMPFYTAVTTIAFFASLGLPGFSGFISEIFVFLGSFSSSVLPKWITVLSVFGIIIGAAYYLWTLQRMFFGKFWTKEENWAEKLTDLNAREYIMMVPLVILALLFGVFPDLLLDKISDGINIFVGLING